MSAMRGILMGVWAALLPLAADAASLSPEQKAAIDESVKEWLAKTDVPSASIAVVKGDGIAYANAYGNARLHPNRPATVDTRYPIASMSKQFTAAAVLALQDEGRLSLDDKVAKFFPDLPSADKITIRELLSHTAGYPDSLVQEFATPEMRKPITLADFLKEWATKPLLFEPGTGWEYSGTGYKIAGAIVEKVSGQSLMTFRQQHLFAPLGMSSVAEENGAPLSAGDAGLYLRHANGPIRPVPWLGAGWTFGSGDLAMTASDLARWDLSVMNRSLLSQQSYDALYTPTKLKNGTATSYTLGLNVWENHGRLGLAHSGGGPGSYGTTLMWPSEKVAIVVLTNNGWALAGEVGVRIANVVLPPMPDEARARAAFAGFREGVIDRKMFTDNANAFLTPEVLADQKAGLAPLGPVRMFTLADEQPLSGFTQRIWQIVTAKTKLQAKELVDPSGKIEEFIVSKAD
jgi:D-alanyl-D-alanine carboxypeptidase